MVQWSIFVIIGIKIRRFFFFLIWIKKGNNIINSLMEQTDPVGGKGTNILEE
jgi:hypothetical protein